MKAIDGASSITMQPCAETTKGYQETDRSMVILEVFIG